MPSVPGRAERLPSMSFHLARWHPRRGAAQTSANKLPFVPLADSYPRADWPEEWALLPRSHFKPLLRAATWPHSCQEKGPRLQRLMTAESEAAPCKMAAGGGRRSQRKPLFIKLLSSSSAPEAGGPGHWLPCQYGRPSGPAPTSHGAQALPRPRLCRPGRIGC